MGTPDDYLDDDIWEDPGPESETTGGGYTDETSKAVWLDHGRAKKEKPTLRSLLITAEYGDLTGRLQQMSLKELWNEALKYGQIELKGDPDPSDYNKEDKFEASVRFHRPSGSWIWAKGKNADSIEQALINAIIEAVKLKDY